MSDDMKVALVSNRGPVSFVETSQGFSKQRGAGGLAGALDPVARRLGRNATWICAATSGSDRKALEAGEVDTLEQLLGYPVHMLGIKPDVYGRYYDVVSNRMLWFANHCLWDELDIHQFGQDEIDAWDEAYEPVNEKFARAAAEYADPDSLVLFHFTHSSFCGPDGLERLPRPLPRRVIEGMLGADLIGFHVPHWAEGFYGCCDHIGAEVDRTHGWVDFDGHRSWVRTYPIPIEADQLWERARGEEARLWKERFLSGWTHGGPAEGRLIVRADRTEPSKNIIRGFEAFGRLLDRRPDLAATTRFIACLYPSRQSMPEYRRYSDGIEAVVDEVKARHPGSIQLFLQDDFDRTLAALRIYDVLLVNPIMDGMNLVSKEGPALNETDGVLVLSRGAGSFDELGDHAIEIADSLDVDSTAAALEAALEMDPQEKKARAAALRQVASGREPADWIDAQLADLRRIQAGAEPSTPPPPVA